jgi:beta-mannanase
MEGIVASNSIEIFDSLSLTSEPFLDPSTQPKTKLIGRFQSWAGDAWARVDFIFLNQVRRRGAIPYITWEPWSAEYEGEPSHQPNYKLTKITSGQYDTYIAQYARDLKRYGYPVFLRFAHEMNGHWYPWGGNVNGNTPAEYILAWRHVHNIFQQEGATNVLWVWAPNEPYQGELNNGSEQFAIYYPGDEYVDWVGFSAYNWGKYQDFHSDRTFSELTKPPYDILSTYGKPIMIAEINSTTIDVNKKAWIEEMKTALPSFPLIKGIMWYESEQGLFSIERELFLGQNQTSQ